MSMLALTAFLQTSTRKKLPSRRIHPFKVNADNRRTNEGVERYKTMFHDKKDIQLQNWKKEITERTIQKTWRMEGHNSLDKKEGVNIHTKQKRLLEVRGIRKARRLEKSVKRSIKITKKNHFFRGKEDLASYLSEASID
jgi:hypothetical protein